MKVCFFSQYSSTNNAGASLSMFNIANEMAHRGIDVTIVLANKNNFEKIEINDAIKVLQIPFYSMRMTLNLMKWDTSFKFSIKSLYNKFVANKIALLLNKDKPDVIHINGLDNAIGAQVAHLLRIPYVWHIRQFLEDDFGQKLFHEEQIYSLVRKANEVIAISEDVRRNFEPIICRQIKVVYNGIPQEKYDSPDHEIMTGQQIRILLAGRIYVQKGQMVAIKAVEILKAEGLDNITLTLVGQGEAQEYLQLIKDYICEHGLEDSVQVLEHTDNLLELRRQHDIGLTCSQREAFGRVTVENMMAGLLAIGANSGGTPEIITDGVDGFLYEVDDPQSLANVIKKAVINAESSKVIASVGYKHSIDHFSITRVVDEVVCIYESVSAFTIKTRGINQ